MEELRVFEGQNLRLIHAKEKLVQRLLNKFTVSRQIIVWGKVPSEVLNEDGSPYFVDYRHTIKAFRNELDLYIMAFF